jgi:phosphoadenosine phosphosulfate reductase
VPYRAATRSTTTRDLEGVARGLEHAAPQEVLEWAVDAYGEGLTLSVSFGGAEGVVLLDMLSRITDRVRVFTLDTGFLFPETVKFREELMRRYGLSLEVVRPKLNITQQAARIGERLYAFDPDACCRMRKVEPLERALEGYSAWVTGIRRDQTAERRDTPVVGWEERFGVVKVAPLARWSVGQVDEYVRRHDLPLNPLLEKGYRSIGCVPCTRPVEHGEDARAGRWAGTEKTECGLHWMQEGA